MGGSSLKVFVDRLASLMHVHLLYTRLQLEQKQPHKTALCKVAVRWRRGILLAVRHWQALCQTDFKWTTSSQEPVEFGVALGSLRLGLLKFIFARIAISYRENGGIQGIAAATDPMHSFPSSPTYNGIVSVLLQSLIM
eukprot:755603-Amphidinium_carterae.1